VVGSGGNEHQLIPQLTSQILQGEVTVFRNAGRDLLHVRDLVRLTVLLLGRTTGIVNVASGICTPSGEIVRWLIGLLGVQAQIREIDTGEQQHFDTTHLRGLLGDRADFPVMYPRSVLEQYVSTLDGRSSTPRS
jgi:nucleoside-diphosphate-sugar epimerase